MFEGQPPVPAGKKPQQSADGNAEDLRPVRWDELVARLSAARDLQAELQPGEQEGEGSFDADSARRIAAHMNGKPQINLEGSSNVKGPGGTAAGAAHDAGHQLPQGAVRK